MLDGKVAFVTGGGSGIGRSIVLRLMREGANVAINDIDPSKIEDVMKETRMLPAKALAVEGDASDRVAIERMVRYTLEKFERIDFLVNNVGISVVSPFTEINEEDWRKSFRINVDSIFYFCKAVVPIMIRQGGGKIVNISSWLGKVGRPFWSVYCATKFAVLGLTEALALELAPYKINVNAVCPGIVEGTSMRAYIDEKLRKYGLPAGKERVRDIPLGRFATTDDVANIVAFLLSKESDYLTGIAINVTGGMWLK